MTVDKSKVEFKFGKCTIDSYNLKQEMHRLSDKIDVSEEKKKEKLKEENILEEVKNVKKMEKDVPEELPRTERRSDASKYRYISEMRAESGKMRRDAQRTPTSLRKVRKIGKIQK